MKLLTMHSTDMGPDNLFDPPLLCSAGWEFYLLFLIYNYSSIISLTSRPVTVQISSDHPTKELKYVFNDSERRRMNPKTIFQLMFVCYSQYYSNGQPFKDILEITPSQTERAREVRIVPQSISTNLFRSQHFKLNEAPSVMKAGIFSPEFFLQLR